MTLKQVVKDAKKDVLSVTNADSLPDIKCLKIKECLYLQNHRYVSGFYDNYNRIVVLNKSIAKDMTKKGQYKLVYHELGHYIHHRYLNYRAQYLPRKHHGNRDYYCNTNQKESFACCFADYMWCMKQHKLRKIEKSPRLNKMDKIIKNLF